MKTHPSNNLPVPLAISEPVELDHDLIVAAFEMVGKEAHRHASASGFWRFKKPKEAVFEKLCLVVTEVGEAIEHLRYGRWRTTKRLAAAKETAKEGIYEVEEEGFEDECADVVIRLADLMQALDFNLGESIVRKLYKNRRRGYRRGGKGF